MFRPYKHTPPQGMGFRQALNASCRFTQTLCTNRRFFPVAKSLNIISDYPIISARAISGVHANRCHPASGQIGGELRNLSTQAGEDNAFSPMDVYRNRVESEIYRPDPRQVR